MSRINEKQIKFQFNSCSNFVISHLAGMAELTLTMLLQSHFQAVPLIWTGLQSIHANCHSFVKCDTVTTKKNTI
jgi:hypothetical protein